MVPAEHTLGRLLYLRLLSVTCRSPGAGIGMPTSSSAVGEWQLSPVPWARVPRAACGASTSLTISATKTDCVNRDDRGWRGRRESLALRTLLGGSGQWPGLPGVVWAGIPGQGQGWKEQEGVPVLSCLYL